MSIYHTPKTWRPHRFYIGDPVFIFGVSWPTVQSTISDVSGGPTEAVIFNRTFFIAPAGCGPGVYYDQKGHKYPCDSGFIGIFPAELVDRDKMMCEDGMPMALKFGRILDFRNYFRIHYEEGVFRFGRKIILDTTREDQDFEYS